MSLYLHGLYVHGCFELAVVLSYTVVHAVLSAAVFGHAVGSCCSLGTAYQY
jgi:hypothetical protein